MGSFVLGVLVIVVSAVVCLLTGNTPQGGWYIPFAVGGWLCFAPIRRAMWGRS